MQQVPISQAPEVLKPGFGALVAGHRRIVVARISGETEILTAEAAVRLVGTGAPLAVCHAPETAHRLGRRNIRALDVLELFAFACPAQFCHPTPSGLAEALDLDRPTDTREEARALLVVARELLVRLQLQKGHPEGHRIAETAHMMAMARWPWTPFILEAMGAETLSLDGLSRDNAMHVWHRLSEWSDEGPPREPGDNPVTAGEARRRLARLVGRNAEDRPQQGDYTSAVSRAFASREQAHGADVVLVEAGTGIGKTFGYLAPATVWAERNDDSVWISTFTRNLQRQIDRELERLYPDPEVRRRKVVIRKGRENYLCLLNFREAVEQVGDDRQSALPLGLMSRWIEASRDGDIEGGDFPGWLVDLVGVRHTTQLTDRRGECVYSACDHYNRCFVEKTVRRARRADVVIANHALVLNQGAHSNMDDRNRPGHLVFDEGHHLFDASDSAFAHRLSGRECAALRQWLLGPENHRPRRAKGLRGRTYDLGALDEDIEEEVGKIAKAALMLPEPGWIRRIEEGDARNQTERFLQALHKHIYYRAARPDSFYDLEITTDAPSPELIGEAADLARALSNLIDPMVRLVSALMKLLDQHKNTLLPGTRNRIESVARSLESRVDDEIQEWQRMLVGIPGETAPEFVEWFSVSKVQGRDVDVGMHRHWIDPMKPFVETVVEPAKGVVITSATLRDGTGDPEADWRSAEERTGMVHLENPCFRAQVPSPFDYPTQTRVFIVTDVDRDNPDEVAEAYRQLFLAADGGALGLFTAIRRLREVHNRLAPEMENAGYPLLAQHVDRMNPTSLISIFRAEERSCLLGTDALRDGVDVPGRSLHLIVFDRLPWPPRTVLHRARSKAFTGGSYDDLVIRLRLRQAFGRLVRRNDDCGVFVMLDPRMSARLAGAFPEGVEIRRTGLTDAVEHTQRFLSLSG